MINYSFQKQYKDVVIPVLKEAFGYKNIQSIPRLDRAVINVGVGRMLNQRSQAGVKNEDAIKDIVKALALISGQKPIIVRSKKSIAGFKLRAGMISGVKVTLRRSRAEEFLGRLAHVALPRTRDFRGIRRSTVDPYGNLTIGIKESIIFPELAELTSHFGLEVTFVSTAKTRDEAFLLFEKLGIPFQKEKDN
ncbi:MAG: 50S ribosomal protein L5 [Candidatus Spechtbacteria bacterium]|nr:50S ribosomal protein L5 [Candidatus Spechtbacteria bacterium]